MPSYLIAAGKSDGESHPLNSTSQFCPMGLLERGAEVNSQTLVRDSYILSNLYVYIAANTITDTTTLRSRKQTPPAEAANGNQSVSIPASTTGAFTDAVNADSLVNGDLFCTQIVTPNVGTDIFPTIVSYILSTETNTTPILGTKSFSSQSKNLVRWWAIVGANWGDTSETNVYYKFRVASTLSNLRIFISSNTVTAASTLITRINGGNGSQSVSITASTTGAFEDTTNTDSISVGQNVNYQLTTGATGTSLGTQTIQMKSNSAGRQVAATRSVPLASNLTRYVTIEGTCQYFNANETLVQATARSAFTAKNMYVNISANTVTATSIFTLRKDTGNSALTVSVGANATGQFEDTDPAHAVDFVAASLINWGIVTGATGTAITIVCIGFELAQPTPPPPVLGSANMASKMVAAGLI